MRRLVTAIAQASADMTRSRWVLLAFVLSVGLLVVRIHSGFLPEDDPALAHQAERVLNGELPHVDFHEMQTGGLSFLHALAFRMFGVNLLSMRLALLLFFMLWVPAFWYIASRIVCVGAASSLTLLAATWTVPLYPCPLPSWYCMYFAVFGTAALFRYIETQRARWLFAAGALGAISFLIKISGLYFIAALVLFLLFDEQDAGQGDEKSGAAGRIYSILITLGLSGFAGALFLLIRSRFDCNEAFYFLLPGAVLAGLLIVREWSRPRSNFLRRLHLLLMRAWPVALGLAIPIAVFLARYFHSGNLHELWNGVFVLPAARIQSTFMPPFPILWAGYAVPLFVVVAVDVWLRLPALRIIVQGVITIALEWALLRSLTDVVSPWRVWASVGTAVPILVLAGTAVLWRIRNLPGPTKSRLMVLLAAAALCSLIQFPFSAPMYFSFVVPLAILAFTAVVAAMKKHSQTSLFWPIGFFYLLFALTVMMPSQFYSNSSFVASKQRAFVLPRGGGVSGDAEQVQTYERASAELARHARGGSIYSGPDAPEFYFLTGLKNPTPVVYEFLAGKDGDPKRLLDLIDAASVRAVVLNTKPNYSGRPSPELVDGLRMRFPESTKYGKFEVRWKPEVAALAPQR